MYPKNVSNKNIPYVASAADTYNKRFKSECIIFSDVDYQVFQGVATIPLSQ